MVRVLLVANKTLGGEVSEFVRNRMQRAPDHHLARAGQSTFLPRSDFRPPQRERGGSAAHELEDDYEHPSNTSMFFWFVLRSFRVVV